MKKTISLLAVLLIGSAMAVAQPGAGAWPQAPAQAPALVFPQPDVMFNLWPDGAPTDNGLTGEEKDYGNHVSNVTKPTLAVFLRCLGQDRGLCQFQMVHRPGHRVRCAQVQASQRTSRSAAG